MADRPVYEIIAHSDVPPREHAKTDFTVRMSSERGLRSKLQDLRRDGYETVVRLPSGMLCAGDRFPDQTFMDDDLGYGPKPEHAHRVHLVEGTWMLKGEE